MAKAKKPAGPAAKKAAVPAPRTTRPARAAAAPREAKTTHPDASSQREPPPARSTAEKLSRKFDALPDRIDVRDWVYQPSLAPLPNRIINCHEVDDDNVLDQGTEGACTGYALGAVINFLLSRRGLRTQVSPRMIYELARRYDEWPGEEYDGSSARGAMKGWVRHGVCASDAWPTDRRGLKHYTSDVATKALEFPGGAFYRVMHRQVRDMHAALAETGVLYCTLMVHSGWDAPDADKAVDLSYDRDNNHHTLKLPVIVRPRRERADAGHAVAIVGYTREGFIIQNSWGLDWGRRGFALLPYDDYLMHATDVWVAQLGVPVAADLWTENKYTETTAGLARVREAIQLHDIRPFIIDVGNNGELSRSGDYWTSEDDVEMLFSTTIPDRIRRWEGARAAAGEPKLDKKRILLYLHGGLNSEVEVAQRVMAFRDVMLENEIYPLHIMWETGVMESIRSIIGDFFTEADDRAGSVGDWLKKFRAGLIEAKDRTFELTVAGPGSLLWDEMKENARLASEHPLGRGAMQIVARKAKEALQARPAADRGDWEIHIVAHSAGSIFAGHALRELVDTGLPIRSIQLMAPAITVSQFEKLYAPVTRLAHIPYPTLYVLSEAGERDDDVGPYGKSLLYLVSNAFEGRRKTSVLGMETFLGALADGPASNSSLHEGLAHTVGGWPALVVAGAESWPKGKPASGTPVVCKSETHGGFDNDPDTLNSVLWRILGHYPRRPFELRDLQF